jgi:hypothetical protein
VNHFDMHLNYIRNYFGYPRKQPPRDPEAVEIAVIQGDGRSDEAAAAVSYWCDFTREEAEDFVTDVRRKWSEQVEASLSRPRQLPLDFEGSRNDERGRD